MNKDLGIEITFRKRFKDLYLGENFNNMKEAAIALKVSTTVISNSINYGIIPNPSTLANIANYFECSINYLLGRLNEEDSFVKSEQSQPFIERLTVLMEERKITYYRLGKNLHIERTLISAWKNKGSIPSLENLDLVADYFKCSIDYLLGRTDLR